MDIMEEVKKEFPELPIPPGTMNPKR